MGIEDTEKKISSTKYMSAEEISNKTGIGLTSTRKHLNSLVLNYFTVKTKTIMINKNWRKVYKLK